MFYGALKKFDVADGEGVRVSLFVSGCRNCCKGCFQPETWNFNYGKEFTADTIQEILDDLKQPLIQGFSILGGDPFEEENQAVLVELVEIIKETYPEKDIWCWTGYLYEDLIEGGKKHTGDTDAMLKNIDVLVDGPFVEAKRNLMLLFRGSENQRLLRLKEGKIISVE